MVINKAQTHGKIGEATVTAKCWMYGIPAYNTAGLRANFAGSDLIIDTANPKKKLLVQVKTWYVPVRDQVYLTQCAGEKDLTKDKFDADFVVFVNIDGKVGSNHQHDGSLNFQHLSFFVVPREDANRLFRQAVQRDYDIPLRKGGRRKLANMAVYVPSAVMERYKDAWELLRNVQERV